MKKLYRSRSDVMIAGVCGGLADYLGLDSTVVRLIFVVLLFAHLSGFLLYVILWIVMPIEPGEVLNSVEVKSRADSSTTQELPQLESPSVDEKKSEK